MVLGNWKANNLQEMRLLLKSAGVLSLKHRVTVGVNLQLSLKQRFDYKLPASWWSDCTQLATLDAIKQQLLTGWWKDNCLLGRCIEKNYFLLGCCREKMVVCTVSPQWENSCLFSCSSEKTSAACCRCPLSCSSMLQAHGTGCFLMSHSPQG